MTYSNREILNNLDALSPDERVRFLLTLAERLVPALRDRYGSADPLDKMYASFRSTVNHGRKWLRGEIENPWQVIDPVEDPKADSFVALEMENASAPYSADASVIGSLVVYAIALAGQLQFARVGDPEVPQSLEGEITSEVLVAEAQRTLEHASREFQDAFDKTWNDMFPPS